MIGKRIGYLRSEEGKHNEVDKLVAQAILLMKKNGAEIIKLENFIDNGVQENASKVMSYEFKHGINKYLKELGNQRPAKNLEELIELTYNDSIEMRYFNLERMENAQKKGNLNDIEYINALKNMLNGYRKDGIDRIMDFHNLDAIICPSGSPAWKTDLVNGDNFKISSSEFAALSGYPNITIPMGFIGNLPVGLSFFGRKWSEPKLIEIAYAYEKKTNFRIKPEFLFTD